MQEDKGASLSISFAPLPPPSSLLRNLQGKAQFPQHSFPQLPSTGLLQQPPSSVSARASHQLIPTSATLLTCLHNHLLGTALAGTTGKALSVQTPEALIVSNHPSAGVRIQLCVLQISFMGVGWGRVSVERPYLVPASVLFYLWCLTPAMMSIPALQ